MMRVTAYHLLDNLASALYEDVSQCLAELVRNSVVASSNGGWNPGMTKIEIDLVDRHPLCPEKKDRALVFLDHGSGLTDPALDRYCTWLGTPSGSLATNGNGASQKGIGRLAALALNSKCINGEIHSKINNGYYLLSRTSRDGQVRFVPVIPKLIEEAGGIEINRFISPTSSEMGALKGIQGSFTAIVIPSPVFDTHEEIYEKIKWHLPRERDKMFELKIGGKIVEPPPLRDEINITGEGGKFRARLGAAKEKDMSGCWLCDSETGLRVASCIQLSNIIPDPIWYPELTGDIFAPGLLKYQNTSRSTLTKDFLKSKGNKDWNKLLMFLVGQVVPAAQQLIETDIINGKAAETLDDLVEMFNETFGEPEPLKKVRTPFEDRTHFPIITPIKDVISVEKFPKEKYQRYVSIRVFDETFHLYRGRSLAPFIFAQVSPDDQKMVFVNIRGQYKALPETKLAQREHCLMQILSAVGQSKYPTDQYRATQFTNEVRSHFLKKK